MLSSSWRVSIIISWNPYISLTAGKAKQELALTIYNKRHRNIQRLSDLPRDTTLMSVNLGREHGWYPGSWEPELLWHLRPCSWCLNDEMPSASLSNAPASSFHWERGDVLEEAEPRGVQLHNADPTSPFLAVTPVKKVSFEQSNSKGPGKSELVAMVPQRLSTVSSHTEPSPWPGDFPESPVVWAMLNPTQNILHPLHVTDLPSTSFSFIEQPWMST